MSRRNAPAYFVRLRARCRAFDLCLICRTAAAVEGGSKCVACRDKQRAYMRNLRATKTPGRCRDCRRPSEPERNGCSLCLAFHARVGRSQRRLRIAQGRCIKCSRPVPAETPVRTCSLCQDQALWRANLLRAVCHG